MSQYFDKDFIKFLIGFVTLIGFSILIIMLVRAYESGSQVDTKSTRATTQQP